MKQIKENSTCGAIRGNALQNSFHHYKMPRFTLEKKKKVLLQATRA